MRRPVSLISFYATFYEYLIDFFFSLGRVGLVGVVGRRMGGGGGRGFILIKFVDMSSNVCGGGVVVVGGGGWTENWIGR